MTLSLLWVQTKNQWILFVSFFLLLEKPKFGFEQTNKQKKHGHISYHRLPKFQNPVSKNPESGREKQYSVLLVTLEFSGVCLIGRSCVFPFFKTSCCCCCMVFVCLFCYFLPFTRGRSFVRSFVRYYNHATRTVRLSVDPRVKPSCTS